MFFAEALNRGVPVAGRCVDVFVPRPGDVISTGDATLDR